MSPEFYPDTGTWEITVSTHRHVAKTLRQLQLKLPTASFEGYYPSGYRGLLSPPKPPPVIQRTVAVEQLLAIGKAPPAIAAAVEALPPVPFVVKEKLPKQRRAAYNGPRVKVPWTREEDLTLQRLLMNNYTATQIRAEAMPYRSRNSIIGRAHRKGYELKNEQGFSGGRPKKKLHVSLAKVNGI